jgi:hypothetical protein
VIEDTTDYITDTFVGHNSLKAWKLEHDKQTAELGGKDKSKKPKSPKGNKSPQKTDREKSPSATKTKSPRGKKSATGGGDTNRAKSTSLSPSGGGADTPKPKSPQRGNSPKTKVSQATFFPRLRYDLDCYLYSLVFLKERITK